MTRREKMAQGANEHLTNHTQFLNDVLNVKIIDIKLNPYQPRKTFNDESIKELSQSISTDGLLQPISINKDNILIAGERRLRACRLLGLKTIKAILVKDVDDSQLERLAIIENLQREDLNLFEESDAIAKLVSKSSERKVANIIGKSKGYINNRLYLSRLSIDDRKKAIDNKLSITQIIAGLVKTKKNVSKKIEKEILKKDFTNIKASSNQTIKEKSGLDKTKKEYILTTQEKEIKKIYSDSGFEIFFSNKEIAIRGEKQSFNAYSILKLLRDKK